MAHNSGLMLFFEHRLLLSIHAVYGCEKILRHKQLSYSEDMEYSEL